jgi:ribosome-dependent ATPase
MSASASERGSLGHLDPAIELRGVQHYYGKQCALENLSLSLPNGTTIGLIGPDGVGKSTLLGLIAGSKRIQHGSVRVLGADLTRKREREAMLPHLAYMPQGLGRNLYPTLSVHENVDFFGRLFGLDRHQREARIQRLLQATGLAPFTDRPAGKLSGGMKQKLGLCGSLVHDPDLLILDEPTTGVDPLSRRQFWTLVDSLRAERPGMTVIVATAYMEEAERFEYLVAMDAGRLLVSDWLRNVMSRTGAKSLEEAYVSLLPEEGRPEGGALTIPPYVNPGGASVIEAEKLTKRFGDFVAVDSVSFNIARGEIFGFLGSNGCGKTTTMKMLTGLHDVTSGSAKLLGQQIDPHDMRTRLHIGYMSQAFSLYEELTVRHNLRLHARLYQLEEGPAQHAVETALRDFDLEAYAEAMPSSLPLGIRQRLQLAAACLHDPEVLLLDEPTSGVDPAARDMFWRHLSKLSREKKVTLFVSTHFMNEAALCDRISLMHRGKVLAVDTPSALVSKRGAQTLEEAFISYLEEAEPESAPAKTPEEPAEATTAAEPAAPAGFKTDWLARIWAFARRESTELARDHLRLAFALGGPLMMLLISAYAVSFDVEHIRYTVLDEDQSHESREFLDRLAAPRYFQLVAPSYSRAEADARLRRGEAQFIVDIPPDFGRDLIAARSPRIGFFIDGATPFTGTNVRGYMDAIMLQYAAAQAGVLRADPSVAPISIEPRFAYNQEFKSIYAGAPGCIMLAMILIPAMLTALGVVREKEIGSILNLYASPATVGEFLLGKQLPYVGIAMVSYVTLVLTAILILDVPLKGSFLGLTLGALVYVVAGTALGLLISTFVGSQVAAIFGTAIICMIPGVNFSGLLYPVSTLTGPAYWTGLFFPASWFQLISLGAFTKGLGTGSFLPMYAALAGFGVFYLLAARLLLKKQEK